MSEKEFDAGSMIGHFPCIANEVDGKKDCYSSDAMACYEHEGNETTDGEVYYDAYCYSCNQSFTMEQTHNSSMGGELGVEGGVVTKRKPFEKKPKSKPMEMKEVVSFIKSTGYTSGNYRGIKDEYSQFFGHLSKLDKNGEVTARYYPETKDGKVTGYKCRNHPKDFRYGKLGLTGLSCELSGQVKFKDYKNHRDILIVGGEEDKAAAFQMLRDNQIRKGQKDYAPMAVVSCTTGESSAIKQIRAQYDFLNQFENIILGLDNDDVGNKAMLEIAEVLPKEKVKIASWSGKDANAMLQKEKEKQFLSDFYNAKPIIANGIMASTGAMEYIEEELLRPRIKLPEYMKCLEKATNGGFLQGRIINIIGDTSCGKSTHVNGMEYYWMFNAPERTGVVSLEATAGQYSLDMLSLHLGKNLSFFGTGEEVLSFLKQKDTQAACDDLWVDDYGEPRWHILDEREGDIKLLEKQMECLIKKHGCKILIIDVLSDILRGLSNDQQSDHMMFQKNLIKTGVTIINVLHTRKPPPNRDGVPQKSTEFDALGSSAFVQSAAINIVINRNKMAKDDIEKNSTYVDLPKCRGGITGQVGVWYYDVETRQVYDRDQYFQDNPEKLPEGYDLTISSFDKEYYEDKEKSSGFKKKGNKKEQPKPDIMDNELF
tara:strand:- start:6217 stop:8178 length:1962 start_codon:yes stop_codon:yes gene_type:complete